MVHYVNHGFQKVCNAATHVSTSGHALGEPHSMSTVTKALGLLDHFSEARPALGLTELQRLAGRDKATVYRHLLALEEAGFVEQDPKTRAYRLGHSLVRLAGMRARTVHEADTIAPLVDQLAEEVGELVHVSRPKGDSLQPIYHADAGHHAIRVILEADLVLDWTTTSTGKSILAYSDAATQARRGAEPREMETIRNQGHAVCFDEFEAGVSSIGIPIFGPGLKPVAACAIAFPSVRRSPDLLGQCILALFAAGPHLSRQFGGQPPAALGRLWSETRHPEELIR